jgi:hypothetical protein
MGSVGRFGSDLPLCRAPLRMSIGLDFCSFAIPHRIVSHCFAVSRFASFTFCRFCQVLDSEFPDDPS